MRREETKAVRGVMKMKAEEKRGRRRLRDGWIALRII
jgi:hypothetical protein